MQLYNKIYRRANITTKVLSCRNSHYTIISMNVLSHCTKQNALSKFEALRVAWLKIFVYWNVPLCLLTHTYQYSEDSVARYSLLSSLTTLKMQVARFFKPFVLIHKSTWCQMPEHQSFHTYSSLKMGNIYGIHFYIFKSTDQFTFLKMPHRYAAALKTLPPDLDNVFCVSTTVVNHI